MNLTVEQKSVYDKIMRAVNKANGGFFFLYGYRGTGKTFIWKTLSSGIRSGGDIVLTVVYSEIAPLLYQQRAILALTLDMVESINEYMVSLNHSPKKIYLNYDTVGVPMMLLRNIDQSSGLCNGTRLIITKLENQVIEAKVLYGNMAGQKVFTPRMTLTPSDARIPFKFQLRQFPIVVYFSMTINKNQGQSLSHMRLFLKKPVFTHGQLYVALSRVMSRKGLKILVYDDNGQIMNEARNVVYKEIFHNLV
ncbi:uncharacterized protein LOC142162445 [Nicotiana tabacum]|uniref:Uncharacterized protein LOC142162445 n=1 Tax=Nicotiana tabacum TaxID=4097 RepID=A0AC58RQ92_TOBAC